MYIWWKKIRFELSGKVIHLPAKAPPKGAVLLSYITFPFLCRKEHLSGHSNRFECLEIARLFQERGYEVDVIDWTNVEFVPRKRYAYCVDIHNNIDRLNHLLNTDCVKILHLTTSEWQFQNKAEMERLSICKNRTGVQLLPRRMLEPTNSIEKADYITLIGNKTTEDTYRKAGVTKEIFRLPVSSPRKAIFFEKDINAARNTFIWLGGSGMVHKGLDITLEAFQDIPDHQLHVFGNVSGEKDFASLYEELLFKTPNIHCHGKISLGSQEFIDIANRSIAIIHPSCSEGQSGAVVECMHHGLIPIISAASGVDVTPFGEIVASLDKQTIMHTVLKISTESPEQLRRRSLSARTYAIQHHTLEQFSSEYTRFLHHIHA